MRSKFILLFTLLLSACGRETTAPPAEKYTIEIVAANSDLMTGLQTKFTVVTHKVSGGATHDEVEPKVRWRSTNPARADVDSLGNIRAYSPGPVGIIAELLPDGTPSDTLDLNIILDDLPVREILDSLKFTKDTIVVGEKFRAVPFMRDTLNRPVSLTDKFISWGTEKLHVAIVDDSGYVTGIGAGRTCVTAIVNGMGRCRVITVIGGDSLPAPLESVGVTADADTIALTDTTKSMHAQYKDKAGLPKVKGIAWGSHNELALRPDARGRLKPKRAQNASVTAIVNNVASRKLMVVK